jgi:hypothetical protein
MHRLTVEKRSIRENTSLSFDIAKHISEHLGFGPAVIVAKQPKALMASIRKQWMHVLRQVENQRANTNGARKIEVLTKKMAHMQQAEFAATTPLEAWGVDVIFATAEQLLEFAPSCRLLYVATPTEEETLYKISSFMPDGGMVIVYGLPKGGASLNTVS